MLISGDSETVFSFLLYHYRHRRRHHHHNEKRNVSQHLDRRLCDWKPIVRKGEGSWYFENVSHALIMTV